MYIRMILLMIINLYASRVILQQLGVEDYGIYNLVGSIVSMFFSLKSMFAASTQRFLNYEMGRGSESKLLLIYNLSTYINGIISIVFFILVEIIGIWFLECQAMISPERIASAHWVFQFSVITTIIGIMNTPLDACIIAHERMDFYAYLSIFEGVAKLGICYLLVLGSYDKLVLYGALLLAVTICTRTINQLFCIRNFAECHIKLIWDKGYFKRMLSFASWAFFGNSAFALAQSGLNMVLNIFGGPTVNAARGIAHQVNMALGHFVSNMGIVLKPYTIKTYASGDKEKAFDIAYMASKVYFFTQLILIIFVVFLADYLIQFWLGQVPQYVVVFLDLVLIQSLIKTWHQPLDMLFGAEGNIKYYQLFEGVVLFLPVPMSYLLLKTGMPYYTVFISAIFCEIIHIVGIAMLGKHVFGLRLNTYVKKVILPCTLCFMLCLMIYCYSLARTKELIDNVLYMLTTMIMTTILMIGISLNKSEKQIILSIIKRKK